MTRIIFYEKPGCTGNTRQKGLLVAAGHTLEVRDLLSTAWTAASLRPFFGCRPLREWFNLRAPAIRDGVLDPDTLDESAALAAMLASPILIRRPLLQVGDDTRCGFDPAEIAAWIGLGAGGAALSAAASERCPKAPDAPACKPPRP